ncbi:MAG: germination protein YpeB [Clostridia bacterium]|nr:germination protein YpeB [Clostridia bacterium]
MEEKKNNAVEKVENAEKSVDIVKDNKQQKQTRKKLLEQKRKERLAKKQERKALKEQVKAEREKIRAEKRIELARIKAKKKSEKEKAKASKIRERNRKQALLKEKRAERKAEKQRQLYELATIRAQEKKALKEKRANQRQKNKEEGRSYGGWLAAVISLGIVSLVLASALTFTFLMPSASDGMLETNYKRSFTNVVEQVDNIDLNLSKIIATKDKGAMQVYLTDTAVNSELAENDLSSLPLHDENKFYTTKLVNQIGDFSKYLNKKLANGNSLTKEDYKGIVQLYEANKMLKESLRRMMDEMGNNFNFSSLEKQDKRNVVLAGFNELQNLSVDLPELIYDGPFSDGQSAREVKGLKGNQITSEEAKAVFNKIFANKNFEKVETLGESNAKINCYNVQGCVGEETIYAEISKQGGKLIMFDVMGSCEEINFSFEFAVEKAEEFLKNLGIEGMKAVWTNLANNVYTINFAYTENNVIMYADLIKVRVCAETCEVIGLEATEYFTNHVERKVATPLLSKGEAKSKLNVNIEVKSSRLAVVPVGNSNERLCYEFMGELDGATFYVYIDATNGKQVEMFKVVEGTEGTLLM